MAFIPFIGGVKVEMKFLKNGQLVVNVYHFHTDDPITTVNLTALATVLKNSWAANIRGATGTSMQLEEIIATDMSSPTGHQVTYVTGLPLIGTASGDDLPSNVAVVISNKSTLIGRSQRGRTYMTGMVASAITGNTVGSGLQALYVAYHMDILIDTEPEGFEFGVASYQQDNAPRLFAAFTGFSSFQVENITDSQRRRLPGRGA